MYHIKHPQSVDGVDAFICLHTSADITHDTLNTNCTDDVGFTTALQPAMPLANLSASWHTANLQHLCWDSILL